MQLVGAVCGDTADVRERSLFSEDDPYSLEDVTVTVVIYTVRWRPTELPAQITDPNTGTFTWLLGDFLATCKPGMYFVEYRVTRDSDSKVLTWGSDIVDHLPVRAMASVT